MKNFIKKNWYFIAIIIILVVWWSFNIIYDIREFLRHHFLMYLLFSLLAFSLMF